jgi:hypothetical protein
MYTYAGTEPGIPAAPTTLINPVLVQNVKIMWTPPANDGGMSITAYRVLLKSATGLYFEAS